ncbi:MAG: tryptophan--tRNA ligase [Candidatus Pacebacteria bacterium]|nr:tryptophan--tRNA ligase [Candidatus Paceibacterota bacterium]
MRVFSGIQPTSDLHIGNYSGAIKQWVDLQNKAECVFCVVDWHAITVPYEPKTFQQKIKEVAAVYLAAGINPEKSIIFVQSQVKEHAELAWLLNTITPLGDLTRMTQFKEKSAKHKNNVCSGLFNYPVLMAADILLYQSDVVPVGEDQKQHVELTREIAKRFNARFGNVFKIPEVSIPKIGAKVMSLTEPTKKMSKSDKPESRIGLFDLPEQIKKKIGASTTDSGKEIKYNLNEKPGISNLLSIYSLFAEKPIKEIEKEFQGKGYQEFKESLSGLLIEKLAPFRNKKSEFENNPAAIDKTLASGASKAQKIAKETMEKVRAAMNLK